jgi:hypothetical protein
VGHVSRSSSLLRLQASQVRVSQSDLKTGGGVARMVDMASSWRSCGVRAEDGWVDVHQTLLPKLCHFRNIKP